MYANTSCHKKMCQEKTQSINFRCVNLLKVIIQFEMITLFLPLKRQFSFERSYRKIFKKYIIKKRKRFCTKENLQFNSRIIAAKMFKL